MSRRQTANKIVRKNSCQEEVILQEESSSKAQVHLRWALFLFIMKKITGRAQSLTLPPFGLAGCSITVIYTLGVGESGVRLSAARKVGE